VLLLLLATWKAAQLETHVHLVAAVAAAKPLYGLVGTPRQLQRDVAAATLVGHTAQQQRSAMV
jgi:hypothetical protein